MEVIDPRMLRVSLQNLPEALLRFTQQAAVYVLSAGSLRCQSRMDVQILSFDQPYWVEHPWEILHIILI